MKAGLSLTLEGVSSVGLGGDEEWIPVQLCSKKLKVGSMNHDLDSHQISVGCTLKSDIR